MTIKIEGTEMQSVEQLTKRNQQLVSMLPNALPWINIANTSNTLAFANEERFIEQIGLGLSGTSLVTLPHIDLTLDIKKLLDLNAEDVMVLQQDEPDSSTQSSQLADLFSRNHLVTNSELTKVATLFEQSQPSAPFAWSSGLKDSINCYNSLMYIERQLPAKQSAKNEAVKWAVSQSQTLTDFGLNYATYLHVMTNTDSRPRSVDETLATLTRVALSKLDCPIVTFELDQTNLQNAFVQWGEAGNTLGFSSLASGLVSIALNIDLRTKGALEAEAERYLHQLQSLLCEQLASDSYVSQAGQCRHYVYSLPNRKIVLNVDELGCLSVYSDLPFAHSKESAAGSKVGNSAVNMVKSQPLSIN